MANGDLQIFLRLAGIDGESTVEGHEKEIAVLSYDQSLDAQVVHSGGGGSGAGKTQFSGVRLRKSVDAASIPLLLACASGQHVADARFTFRRGVGGFEFYEVTLEDVLVTHVRQCAGTGAQYPLSFEALDAGAASDGFLDEVTLDYQRIRWVYRPQRADGSAGTAVTGGWDVARGRKL
jgi:type VI secretion system secreted protein Hcp